MVVSHENVRLFLLEVLSKATIPGHLAEFMVAVKQEVGNAKVEENVSSR